MKKNKQKVQREVKAVKPIFVFLGTYRLKDSELVCVPNGSDMVFGGEPAYEPAYVWCEQIPSGSYIAYVSTTKPNHYEVIRKSAETSQHLESSGVEVEAVNSVTDFNKETV